MELVLEGNREELTVRVIGEVVAETCGDLRRTVMETLAREPNRVSLNMAEVPFIDTSGVGVLVGLRSHLKSKGVEMVLVEPSPKVRQVLTMTRLSTIFGIAEE